MKNEATTKQTGQTGIGCDVYSCRAAAIASWTRSVAELHALAGQTSTAVSAERNTCARHIPAVKPLAFVLPRAA